MPAPSVCTSADVLTHLVNEIKPARASDLWTDNDYIELQWNHLVHLILYMLSVYLLCLIPHAGRRHAQRTSKHMGYVCRRCFPPPDHADRVWFHLWIPLSSKLNGLRLPKLSIQSGSYERRCRHIGIQVTNSVREAVWADRFWLKIWPCHSQNLCGRFRMMFFHIENADWKNRWYSLARRYSRSHLVYISWVKWERLNSSAIQITIKLERSAHSNRRTLWRMMQYSIKVICHRIRMVTEATAIQSASVDCVHFSVCDLCVR